MATPNYDVNYNDKRFTEVEADKTAAMTDLNNTYNSMINQSDKYYQAQIDASKEWAETQKKNQQEQTDFAIEKIEQQKDQAKQDYTKEQSGAYVDWQKQSNQYGANAEQMATQGMTNTGYSESSQVSMYNTYQNRVVAARESYQRAVLNYDNAIKDAILQNNSILAEIAYESLQKQLELSLQGFQYKNQLILDKTDKKTAIDNTYWQRYQDVLTQINEENKLAEDVRQFYETHELDERKFKQSQDEFKIDAAIKNRSIALDEAKFAYQKEQDKKTASASITKTSGSDSPDTKSTKSTKVGQVISSAAEKVKSASNKASAKKYLNNLIASGASKDKVSNEIALALREGAITNAEAQDLRNKFTPRGVQY